MPTPSTELHSYGLTEYIRDLEALHDRCAAMPVKVREVSTLTHRLAGSRGWLQPQFRQPNKDSYARYLLHRDRLNRFVVLSLVWLPGQATPIHDHSCWGVMGMVAGELTVVNYDRLDDGSRPGYAELQEADTEVARPGVVSHVLPPYRELHWIGNRGSEVAISLHIYGRDLDEVNVYDLVTHRVSRMRIKYYNLDWGNPDFVI
ncbi:MAG: cysteine dioxygenase family protein [Planctomycetes bacterium]|nr:cysteine dioxygenase family protein [Planctomycetota bacterium]